MHEWHTEARCRVDAEAGLWFSDDLGDQEAAKGVCAACPVQIECLNYATRAGEEFGVWGGVGPDGLRRLRQILNDGDPLVYAAQLRRFAAGGREWSARRSCGRCGDRVEEGWWPIDRNGPGATCGFVSTYNRGCRCDRCRAAKSAESVRRRKATMAGLATPEREREHNGRLHRRPRRGGDRTPGDTIDPGADGDVGGCAGAGRG